MQITNQCQILLKLFDESVTEVVDRFKYDRFSTELTIDFVPIIGENLW